MPAPAIAIVGMACEYPDARTPRELFENALAGRRAFRRIPDVRLPLAEYASEDPAAVDATTVQRAALIEGWSFDREGFKVVGSTYRSADLTHWLALDVSDRALRDAGFADGEGLPRERTGVVLGNTLTGEFSRAQALRLRWPYVRRVLEASLQERMEEAEREAWLDEVEARYKAPFEPFGDESLAGGLANTIAGRICNHFDLQGGGFTVDGACASSLLAVTNACVGLESGELDVALAGGVDLSLDPFELVGFARAGALARAEMRVYDRRAEGFWPGEGCGVVVLMREDEARHRGHRIHARIRGWGISSDGAGGISRPERRGQLLALRRAYRRAQIDPAALGYLEGHGTGTVVGDSTELAALDALLQESGCARTVPIASIKAHIGHTKAAAGIAGLIRASCALAEGVVPSMPACERPHPLVDPERGARLQVLARAQPWRAEGTHCAGVSSMGFGGINTHVVLEATEPSGSRRGLSPHHASLAASARDVDLFLLAGPDLVELREQADGLLRLGAGLSRAELADLSRALSERLPPLAERRARAAIVADTPERLCEGLRSLVEWLDSPSPLEPGRRWRLDPEEGCFLGMGRRAGRIGWLFPGQAAPVGAELGALGALDSSARAAAAHHRKLLRDLGLPAEADPQSSAPDTRIAQPAILSASLFALRALERLGIEGDLALGHSVGEIAALAWADCLSDEAAVALAVRRGRIVSESAARGGGMLGLATGADRAELLAKSAGCCLAAINGPRRSVVAGDATSLRSVAESARREGIAAVELPVSHAFHSPHMTPCVPRLAEALSAASWGPPQRRVVSSRTGRWLERDVDLRDHLLRQLGDPVRFADAAETAARAADLLIEVGPGSMLSSLVREWTPDPPVIAVDSPRGSFRGLLSAAGAAFAIGSPLREELLQAERLTRPFDLQRAPSFLVSPCGIGAPDAAGPQPAEPASRTSETAEGARGAFDLLRELVARRCELPVDRVAAGDRLLSDLHLTSIAVSELAARAARELERPPLVAPGEFADATLAQLAEAIESDERRFDAHAVAAGVDAWVRAFEVVEVERRPPRHATQPRRGAGAWRAFAPAGSTLAEPLRAALEREVGGEGVLVHLPAGAGAEGIRALLAGSRAAVEGMEARSFVLVHHGDPATAAARCLHQEVHSVTTRVIEIADGHPEPVARVLREVRGAAPYCETRVDESDRRYERRLRLVAGDALRGAGELPLAADDVLLVTGGGKGIAAECARWLAQRSGCRLALVGRAQPERDPLLREGLERLAADGIRFEYVPADVCDGRAIVRAVERLESALGPIRGLLHGAGRNEPRPLVSLELEHVLETLEPKRRGLEILLERLGAQLRCVVGFGSAIAQIGLPGEAHYAYANEAMAREIEGFARRRPDVRCLALEWSVWSGLGMGDRLGRVEILAAQGISPIFPDVGCAWLETLLRRQDLPVRVFVAGRFGRPPTLAVEERPLPMRRFLERVREWTPGVELVVDAQLSHESDPWLADHVYRGDPLMPGVFALEAMAQAARVLGGERGRVTFEQVRFDQPLTAPEGATVGVRIAALVRETGIIELALRSEATGFATDHARAVVRLRAESELPSPTPHPTAAPCPVDVEPDRELYGDLFFHGPRFERVRQFDALHWNCCSARIESRETTWFGAFQPQQLELGDPGARDAAVHAIQACLPEVEVLPVSVDQIEHFAAPDGGVIFLRARQRSREQGAYVWDLALDDAEGRPLERWHGLTLRAVARPGLRPLAPALLAPRLEEIAADALPEIALRAAVVRGTDREASGRGAGIASGRPPGLRHRADGRPELDEGFASASHAAGLTLFVVASGAVACDLEVLQSHSEETWRDLLGAGRLAAAAQLARHIGEPLSTSATRIWGAAESLRKVGAARETPVVIERTTGSVAILRAGGWLAASWLGPVRGVEAPLVATLLGARDARV